MIFRLSRPVLCKNQENGSGKQWSLHAPLKQPYKSDMRQYEFRHAAYLVYVNLNPARRLLDRLSIVIWAPALDERDAQDAVSTKVIHA